MDSLEQQIYRRYKKLILESESLGAEIFSCSKEPREVKLSDIIDEYDAFCFDGYGTLYNRGSFVYPSALDWFTALRKAGKHLRLVTNAASNGTLQLAQEAAARGFAFTADETISSGSLLQDFANEFRRTSGKRLDEVFYIGRETGKNVLAACGIRAVENPCEPIVAVSSSTATPEMFEHAVEILSRESALLLVLNPDAWAPKIDGSREGVSGALCERLRLQTRTATAYLGKPFKEIWVRVKESLPENARVLMIGDTLGTDVMGAKLAGFDSALVVGRNVPFGDLEDDEAFLGIRPTFYLTPG